MANNFYAAFVGNQIHDKTGNYGWEGLDNRIKDRDKHVNSTRRGDWQKLKDSFSLLLDRCATHLILTHLILIHRTPACVP